MIFRSFSKITVRSPTNIALVKYWGKTNEELNLPMNSSLSLTVDIDQFYTQTSIQLSENNKDRLVLNKQEAEMTGRIYRVVNTLKSYSTPDNIRKGIEIESENNFPTAAGMASSASGLAALTFGLSKAYNLDLSSEELSGVARLGSGSACRSFFGGVVEWTAADSHGKSLAKQLHPSEYWDDLRLLVILTDLEKKKVSSTKAMRLNQRMMLERSNERVPLRMKEIKQGFADKSFEKIARITMEESDDLHYVIENADKPVKYLNARSEEIKNIIKRFNSPGVRAAYTFDAGPNPFILTRKQDMRDLLETLLSQIKLSTENDLKVSEDFDKKLIKNFQAKAEVPVYGIIESKISKTGPILIH